MSKSTATRHSRLPRRHALRTRRRGRHRPVWRRRRSRGAAGGPGRGRRHRHPRSLASRIETQARVGDRRRGDHAPRTSASSRTRTSPKSLQRVPGVVINKEFGEGERVSLRGTAPNLTRTLLNGHGLATADWFILDQLNTTRSFNYLMLPSDIIGRSRCTRAPQADFEEGGIGGTINVITRNPLDLESMAFYGSAQVAYTDLADEYDAAGESACSAGRTTPRHLRLPGRRRLPGAQDPARRRRGARLLPGRHDRDRGHAETCSSRR